MVRCVPAVRWAPVYWPAECAVRVSGNAVRRTSSPVGCSAREWIESGRLCAPAADWGPARQVLRPPAARYRTERPVTKTRRPPQPPQRPGTADGHKLSLSHESNKKKKTTKIGNQWPQNWMGAPHNEVDQLPRGVRLWFFNQKPVDGHSESRDRNKLPIKWTLQLEFCSRLVHVLRHCSPICIQSTS